MKKSVFLVILAAVLMMILPAAAMADTVSYLDENGDPHTAECILIPSQDNYAFESDGWYAVTGDVTITNRIENNAAAGQPAHLILADGASLTAPGGIRNPEGKELIIYGQQASSGQLFIEGIIENAAGIGGNDFEAGGILTINGGTIEAHGIHLAAGIGGGNNRSGGTITINGGVVRAYSEIDANSVVGAGIGGGCYADSGTITITGGVVFAQSGRGSAGIGGGCYANGEKITITGGTVTAKGGPTGAGIGGGSGNFDAQSTKGGYGGEIIILGGTVYATGTNGGAGIGGGQRGVGASGIINGGQVTAMGIREKDAVPGPGVGAGAGSTDQGTLRIITSYIKAGASSAEAKDTTIDDYYKTRNPYINIIPMPMEPIKLSFISQPDRIRYAAGESFDPSGAVMLVDYRNETSKRFTDLTAFVFDVPDPMLFGTEEVNVLYTENGFTVSTTLPIMVSSTKLNVSFNTVYGSFVDTQMVEYGEKIKRPAVDPTREGYNFGGWYTDGGYGTEFDFSKEIKVNTVVYAKWTKKIGKKYLISWMLNDIKLIEQTEVTEGEMPVHSNPEMEGYIFVGWEPALSPVTGNTKYTAYFEKRGENKVAVTFNTDGGTFINTQVIDKDSTPIKPPDPQKAGCKFEGWYREAGFITPYGFDEPVNTDMTLYARWTMLPATVYTVTWKLDSGTLIDTTGVKEGEMPVHPDAEKAGYVFTGWDPALAPVTGDITYTAKFVQLTPEKVAVYFNTLGGSYVETQVINAGEKATKPAVNPNREGYTFDGWYTDSTCSTEFDFNKAITLNTVVYAKWIKNTEHVKLCRIEISVPPDKTTYKEGEAFDKTGMVVTALYSRVIDNYLLSPLTSLMQTDKAVTVSYTENGVTRTAEQAIIVNSTDQPYTIIAGANQTILTTATSALFTSNADFSKFARVEVDGKEVARKSYTAKSGSTDITFNKAYISTLKEGKHTLRIVSTDGSASTEFNVISLPKTGDETNLPMLAILLMVSSALLGFGLCRKKQ